MISLSTVWDIFLKFLGIIIGLAVGVAAYFLVTDAQNTIRFVISVLGTTLATVVVEFLKREKEIKDLAKQVAALRSALADDSKSMAERYKMLREPEQELTRAKLPETWIGLLWRFEHAYSATNFIAPEFIYFKKYAKLAREVQRVKIEVNHVTIRKVFIATNSAELLHLQHELALQIKSGIDVRYIFRSAIDRNSELKGWLEELGGRIDFGLFDSDTVLVWELDDQRNVQRGRILFGEEHFAKFKSFYSALASTARPFVPVKLDRLTSEDAKAINAWPPYIDDLEPLDYALRPGGWLDEFPVGAETHHFAARCEDRIVGFCILTQTAEHPQKTGQRQAELYIAVHDQWRGKGIGLVFMQAVIEEGFGKLGYSMIHLKVRSWHKRAIGLYEALGFQRVGRVEMEIRGKKDTFDQMELNRAEA